MSVDDLRTAMIIDRTTALMAEKYRHDDAQAVLEALSEIGETDYQYLAKSLPLGAERLGNAILNISYAYWERRAREEARAQIAAQWDGCQCHGLGCRHCQECGEFEAAPC